jgi:hypothetical protein
MNEQKTMDSRCPLEIEARGVAEEFSTIDLIVGSGSATLGVDSFALAVLKAERQIRRIFTHIVYQSDAFNEGSVSSLITILARNRKLYFRHFQIGIYELSGIPISEIIVDHHDRLHQLMIRADRVRNKIFHGQLTGQSLSRDELLEFVVGIKEWCAQLSAGAKKQICYDGFSSPSYHKSINAAVAKQVSEKITSLKSYKTYLIDLAHQPKNVQASSDDALEP